MNLDSLSLALSQISYLVDNLTKKNYRASQQEIQHVSNLVKTNTIKGMKMQGTEAGHLYGCMA
jgi:hypothetical protein